MFSLEREVEKWVSEAIGNSCFEGDVREEIQDHLYCEIEKNMQAGLSEESAFYAATRRLGLKDDLKKEFGKVSEDSCDPVERAIRKMSVRDIAVFNAVFLLAFFVFVFGSSYLLKGTGYKDYVTPFYPVFAMVPIVIAVVSRKSKEECAMFKRWFRI